MIFQERTTKTGYTYDVEDVFGTIHIESTSKLDGDTLDDMVVVLLKQNLPAQTVTGEVKHKHGTVTYTYVKRPQWEEDEEEKKKPCENTPTSTKQPERESILTCLSKAPALIWFRRFAEAFREAWRKSRLSTSERKSDARDN